MNKGGGGKIGGYSGDDWSSVLSADNSILPKTGKGVTRTKGGWYFEGEKQEYAKNRLRK